MIFRVTAVRNPWYRFHSFFTLLEIQFFIISILVIWTLSIFVLLHFRFFYNGFVHWSCSFDAVQISRLHYTVFLVCLWIFYDTDSVVSGRRLFNIGLLLCLLLSDLILK